MEGNKLQSERKRSSITLQDAPAARTRLSITACDTEDRRQTQYDYHTHQELISNDVFSFNVAMREGCEFVGESKQTV